VDGEVIATYTPTPDGELSPVPAVKVAGLECPPPSATATLSNDVILILATRRPAWRDNDAA
jgi:hypothetical protein